MDNKILVYLDDAVVLVCSFEGSLSNLKAAFDQSMQYNLKLKPKKCALFKRQEEFLEMMVSSCGISISPSKPEAIKNWSKPTTNTELLSFFGFHIQNYAVMCNPVRLG